MLHTINGQLISSVETEVAIQCLAFSTAPEGRSVNVLAAGLTNGRIKMWSTWDLMPVREIVFGDQPLTRYAIGTILLPKQIVINSENKKA